MLSGIIYREKEIFKHYFLNFVLSALSNFLLIVILFVIFKGGSYFDNLQQDGFLLLSYFLIVIQSQIFCIIYNNHAQRERIFEYTFLFFESKIALLFVRLFFIFILNIVPLVIFYFLSSFVFYDIKSIVVFILSVLLLSLNNIALSIAISNHGNRFISYFVQIFLIPLNWPIFILSTNSDNFSLIFFVFMVSIINGVVVSFFNKVNAID